MNAKEILMGMFFPHASEERINNVIDIIEEQTPTVSFDYKLESMINLLTESGNSTLNGHFNDEEEGAVGYATTREPPGVMFSHLALLFPDIDEEYLRELVAAPDANLGTLVEKLSSGMYPKKDFDYLDVWKQLQVVLPGADPSFLKRKARELCDRPEELDTFIQDALENNDYPTMQDYLKQQQEEKEINNYINFNAEKYLEEIPNPEEYFSDPKNCVKLGGSDVAQEDLNYAMTFLYNHYKYLRKRNIDYSFNHNNKNLYQTCYRLDKLPKCFKTPRKPVQVPTSTNIPLLQEIAFLENRKVIRVVLKMKDEIYREARECARQNNLLQTCTTCFDEELIPEECYFCENKCIFCKDCMKTGIKVAIGMGEINFECLEKCGSHFSLQTIKMVLDTKTFTQIARKIQAEDIRKANIDGLETCPHCDFSVIPNENDKVFKCENPECMKETCRECRHPGHLPLKCDEIEYDEDVKLRTYIENEMTKALVRVCNSCKKEFLKESGCNKMTCMCGAIMCYLCGMTIDGYAHFNGSNARCPLYTDNLNELHARNVIEGAERAKRELGITSGKAKLKVDPTQNIEAFFR